MSKYRNLFIRTESHDNQELLENKEVGEYPEQQDSYEEAIAAKIEAAVIDQEFEEHEGELQEIFGALEETNKAYEELGDVTALVEEAVNAGEGLSEVEAEQVDARMESISKRLQLDYKASGLNFRRENYKSDFTRLPQTKIRLEGLKEFAKTAEDWIIRLWKAFIEKLKAFSKAAKEKFLGQKERFFRNKKKVETLLKLDFKLTDPKESPFGTDKRYEVSNCFYLGNEEVTISDIILYFRENTEVMGFASFVHDLLTETPIVDIHGDSDYEVNRNKFIELQKDIYNEIVNYGLKNNHTEMAKKVVEGLKGSTIGLLAGGTALCVSTEKLTTPSGFISNTPVFVEKSKKEIPSRLLKVYSNPEQLNTFVKAKELVRTAEQSIGGLELFNKIGNWLKLELDYIEKLEEGQEGNSNSDLKNYFLFFQALSKETQRAFTNSARILSEANLILEKETSYLQKVSQKAAE